MKNLKTIFGSIFPNLSLSPYERAIKGKTFRDDGTVHYDRSSRKPYFVEYNTTRLQIKLAKIARQKNLRTRISNSVEDALIEDGYTITTRIDDSSYENYQQISW